MLNVYLAQVNNTYDRNCFLPYSVGLLQSYAITVPIIRDNYTFKGFFFLRDPVDGIVEKLDSPAIIGISCYIWNFEYSIALGKAIKNKFPQCLLILGGPHVPIKSDGFFNKYGFVDILVHYEGEITFSEILLERLKENPDYTKIKGISLNLNGKTIQTEFRERIDDLDIIPSPYVAGIFDELMKQPYDFHASQETSRGCPYQCSFCDWGSNVMAKIKKFSTERLVEELKWFSINKIDLLYNCDANYGILPRDIELTQKMVDINKATGFPKKFRAAYAKNSNDTIFNIAKMLNDHGMNKGITLSFQSMDDKTLLIVKRKNIKIDNFKNLMMKYKESNIATYSELIIGLPGETYKSFADGIDLLIRCGQHDSIQVYNCELLPNSEMSNALYRQAHGIKSKRTPVLFFHGTPSKDKHQEYYEIVTETAVLSHSDWMKSCIFSCVVQCFHCLSLTQYIAVFMHGMYNISYSTFYERLIEYPSSNIINKIMGIIKNSYSRLSRGEEWGIINQEFGNIVWPPEEGAFLHTVVAIDEFYHEIKNFVNTIKPDMDQTMLDNIILYQRNVLKLPGKVNNNLNLNYNIHEYIESLYLGNPIELVNAPATYKLSIDKIYNDLPLYTKEVVWYGRKGGKFKHTVERIL